ncbi:MAG: histone deacetylase family protein [Steroidobacterales bacterium]
MTTLYITHAACRLHDMGPGHPECPARLDAIDEQLQGSALMSELRCLEAPLALRQDLERVHHKAYVDLIFQQVPTVGYRQLDPDTAMNPHSLDAALRAAGAGILAVDELVAGRARNAFCAVRPCGHHATPGRSMGFCIFNNVAVAAAYALEKAGLARVAVIDFDVHHGNGTEAIFSAPQWRERVLMAGFFQHPFYPYTGTDDPAPNMLNVPLAAGSGGVAARRAVEQVWLPALERFRPQMIFISAGFDAHAQDPLGGMTLVEDDYTWITDELQAPAARHAQGRIVSMLEGGYSLPALARSVAAHVGALAHCA